MKEWFFRFILIALGITASLFFAEIFIRIFHLAPEVALLEKGRLQLSKNSKIGYEPVPLQYDHKKTSFYDHWGPGNNIGYRDYNHSTQNPDDHYRIIILGDSIGAGLGVEHYENTFPAVLEATLRKENIQAEVINLSVPGYNTQQEVETLKDRGLVYNPDLVIIVYCLNDRYVDDGNILATLLEQQAKKSVFREFDPFYINSALFRFARYHIFKTNLSEYHQTTTTDSIPDSLQELAELSLAHQFSTFITVVPKFKNLDNYGHGTEHQWIQQVASKKKMHLFDLLNSMQNCSSDGTPIAGDVYHPNELGHQCIGTALAHHIGSNFLKIQSSSNRSLR